MQPPRWLVSYQLQPFGSMLNGILSRRWAGSRMGRAGGRRSTLKGAAAVAPRAPPQHTRCAQRRRCFVSLSLPLRCRTECCVKRSVRTFSTHSHHTLKQVTAESERERSIARVRVRRHFIPPRQLKHGDGCKGGGDRVDGVRQSSAHPNRAQCNQWQSRSRG